MVAAQGIINIGFEMTSATVGVVLKDSVFLDEESNDCVNILSEGMAKPKDVLMQCSTSRMVTNMDLLCELVFHLGKSLALFDAMRMNECFNALGTARAAWDETFRSCTGDMWPPQALPSDAMEIEGCQHDESKMKSFCLSLQTFTASSSFVKLASLSDKIKDATCVLEAEVQRILSHMGIRQNLWAESLAVCEWMGSTWEAGSDGFSAMFEEVVKRNEGVLAHALRLAAMRPAVGEYVPSVALPEGTAITMAGNPMPALAPLDRKSEFDSFISSWKEGAALSHILHIYLFQNLDAMTACVMEGIDLHLGKLRYPIATPAETAFDSAADVLKAFAPADLVTTLGESIMLLLGSGSPFFDRAL